METIKGTIIIIVGLLLLLADIWGCAFLWNMPLFSKPDSAFNLPLYITEMILGIASIGVIFLGLVSIKLEDYLR